MILLDGEKSCKEKTAPIAEEKQEKLRLEEARNSGKENREQKKTEMLKLETRLSKKKTTRTSPGWGVCRQLARGRHQEGGEEQTTILGLLGST